MTKTKTPEAYKSLTRKHIYTFGVFSIIISAISLWGMIALISMYSIVEAGGDPQMPEITLAFTENFGTGLDGLLVFDSLIYLIFVITFFIWIKKAKNNLAFMQNGEVCTKTKSFLGNISLKSLSEIYEKSRLHLVDHQPSKIIIYVLSTSFILAFASSKILELLYEIEDVTPITETITITLFFLSPLFYTTFIISTFIFVSRISNSQDLRIRELQMTGKIKK